MEIVFLSHTYKGGNFVVGSHHLSRELVAKGHTVAHISTPMSWAHKTMGRGSEERRAQSARGPFVDADGVVNYVPMIPLPSDLGITKGIFDRILGRVGISTPDAIIVDQPSLYPSGGTEGVLVFRPTDIFTRFTVDHRAKTLNSHADVLVATSEPVRQAFSLPTGRPEHVIQNGVEIGRFLDLPLDNERSGFVYVGAVDERFDFGAVVALAEAAPDQPVDVFGPVTTPFDQSSLPPNLTFKGVLDYSSLPTVLAQYRTGLLPFNDHPMNKGRGPMKLYEYLAAGLFAILSNTNEGSPDEAGVYRYTDYSDFPEIISRISQSSSLNLEGRESAKLRSWTRNAERLESIIRSSAESKTGTAPSSKLM